MQYSLNVVFILVCAIVCGGCRVSEGALKARQYPLADRNTWTYLVSDANSETADTVSITVVRTVLDRAASGNRNFSQRTGVASLLEVPSHPETRSASSPTQWPPNVHGSVSTVRRVPMG